MTNFRKKSKSAVSLLLALLMVLSSFAAAPVVFAANGDWVVVHESGTTTYSPFSAGTYYITDGNGHALSLNGTSVTNTALASATEWTFTASGSGFYINNGNNYLRRNSTALGTATSTGNSRVFVAEVTSANTVRLYNVNNGTNYYLAYSGSSWTLTTTPTNLTLYTGSGGYVYTIDNDGVDAGAKYLICGNNYKYIMRVNSSGGIASTAVTVTDGKITLNNDTNDWVFSSATSGSIKWDASDRYLRTNNTSIGTVTSAPSTNFTITGPVSGQAAGAYNLRFYYNNNNNALTVNSSGTYSYTTQNATSKYVWLYKYTGRENKNVYANPTTSTSAPDLWGRINAGCSVTELIGISKANLESAIRSSDSFVVSTSLSANGSSPITLNGSDSAITFDFSSVNTAAAGTYNVPVKYNNYTIGTAQVSIIAERPVKSATLVDTEGNIYAGAAATDSTGAYVLVVYDDDSSALKPVTLDMLSGTFNRNAAGTYTGLSVSYKGTPVTSGFTLNVAEATKVTTGNGNTYTRYTPKTTGQRIENGEYLIYNAGERVMLTGTNITGGISASYNVTLGNNGATLTTTEGVVYTVSVVNAANNTYTIKAPDGRYLNLGSGTASLGTTAQNLVATTSGNNVAFADASNTDNYFCSEWTNGQYTNSNFSSWESAEAGIGDDNCQITLYKPQSETKYYTLSATNHTIYADDPFDRNDINSLASIYVASTVGGTPSETISLTDSRVSKNWVNGFDNSVPGVYPVEISVDGVKIGTFNVTVTAKRAISSVSILSPEGTVYVESEPSAQTGAYIKVMYDDGGSTLIPITVSMLTGTYDLENVGAYTGLTVKYGGTTLTNNFTLYVAGKNDYPEYPEEGSVKVGKSGAAAAFADNGVAHIQLTATGVPMVPGIDVTIVLDTSSSMRYVLGTYNGQDVYCENTGAGRWYDTEGNLMSAANNNNVTNKVTRQDVMENSLRKLLDDMNSEGVNGKTRDIQVAICDFNGYTRISDNDRLSEDPLTGTDNSQVYTGSKKLDADAYVSIESLATFDVTSIARNSGTNYDRAFEEAYTLVKAKEERNAANEENRQQYVIFMSDGGSFQFNYYGGNSVGSWNNWLLGTYSDYTQVPAYASTSHTYFYNGEGNTNRLADAIKGDPDQLYTIIDRNKQAGTVDVTGDGKADDYMHNVNGLGAKLYSIGYCICQDSELNRETIRQNLLKIPTSTQYYYDANSAAQLTEAFDSILNDMKQAGTDAYFLDTMGACYDLQMATNYTKNGVNYTLDPAPKITFIDYELYTTADYNKGIINDYNLIGTRTGKYEEVETITFNADGTEAYSDKKTALGSDGRTTVYPNIMKDGIIYGNNFIYNTTQDTVMVDTKGGANGTNKDFPLPPETFYWYVSIIAQEEHCLEYDVYLTGSMEGTRPAGTYPTNESASLYYTNYLGHPCHRDTVSPKLPWESAGVSYEFYLVNANGEPVNSSGEVVPFANRVLVGNVQNKEILLNNTVSTGAEIAAVDVIPDGYTLYNPDASYTVAIDSGTTPSHAAITDSKNIKGSSNKVTTFYYEANGFYNQNGTVPNVSDYTNTHVAFAVILMPTVIPDAVVIDYGIPVSISLLANDLAIPTGTTVNAISAEIGSDVVLNNQGYEESQFTSASKSLTLSHGTAALAGDKLIYTPTDAEMDAEEVVYYEVILGGRYYYSTVTVYPAQNIYYEDDFFTFTPDSSWQTAGTRTDALQAEDRPGTFNNLSIDFNNVYGYDAAYDDDTVTYSLGSARYTHLDKNTPKSGDSQPLAYFTFRGTGFDLFSLTSNLTGITAVHVFDVAGTEIDNFSVDNYYGYTYTPGDEETFLPNIEAQGGIYQIPIIRARNYAYGTYTVKVEPLYSSFLDHQKKGSYDIYIDGVRIYDPAGDAPADNIKDVYKQDTEANIQYIELRSNIISANDFYKLSTEPEALKGLGNFYPGVMFVDSIDELSGDINEAYNKFAKVGPNNELYLSKGQAVAFYLSLDNIHEAPASIQLGMKVITGDADGSVLVMNSAQSGPEKISVQGGAARYHDITNAFMWNQDLLESKGQTGIKVREEASLGAYSVTGDYSADEWTFTKGSGGWSLAGSSGTQVTLTRTSSGTINAAFVPAGTGDRFTVSATNGLFTFTNTSGYSFEYNGVIIGSDYDAVSFYIYKSDGKGGYTKVAAAEELEDGGKYLLVYDSAVDMLASPETAVASSASSTYKTLYPVVIMNNSDNIISLTNFKVAFNSYAAAPAPKMMLSSNASSASFARQVMTSYETDPDFVKEVTVNTSDISMFWENTDLEVGAEAKLYVRAPESVASIKVGDETITDFIDNGDGTRSFVYSFIVTKESESSTTVTITDANGNVSAEIETGDIEIASQAEPDTPDTPDEPGENEDGFLGWLIRLVKKIIGFFKSIIEWVTSI